MTIEVGNRVKATLDITEHMINDWDTEQPSLVVLRPGMKGTVVTITSIETEATIGWINVVWDDVATHNWQDGVQIEVKNLWVEQIEPDGKTLYPATIDDLDSDGEVERKIEPDTDDALAETAITDEITGDVIPISIECHGNVIYMSVHGTNIGVGLDYFNGKLSACVYGKKAVDEWFGGDSDHIITIAESRADLDAMIAACRKGDEGIAP